MTTFIDAARRERPAGRVVAGRRADAPVGMPRQRVARPGGETRTVPGRVVSRASEVHVADEVAACGRARLRGEWLRGEGIWLTSVAIFTFLIVMLVGLFGLGDAPGGGDTGDTAIVEVRAGDTLWEIAGRTAPDSDPRAVVAKIVELNRLDETVVRAGRLLVVPAER